MTNIRICTLLAISIAGISGCSVDTANKEDSAQSVPATTVRIANVERRALQSWVFGEGTARAVSREFLSFESAGRIAYVDPSLKEGDAVVQGQLIAYQEKNRPSVNEKTGEQSLLHAAVSEAEANLQLAQKTFERYALLLEKSSASRQEYDEAQAQLDKARINYENALIVAEESRIVAPIAGIVARLNIEQGYYFTPQQIQSTSEAGALNTVPVVLIDPTAYEITVQLPTYAHRLLKVGNPVLIASGDRSILNTATEAEFAGRRSSSYQVKGVLYAISPSIDPSTRTFAVKIRSTQGAQHLQDGQFVTTRLGGLSVADAVTIPLNATRYDKGQPFVFIYDASSSTVSRREVSLGLRGDDHQQVITGLEVGMQVVTEGRSRLSDGDPVRLASIAIDGA